MALEDYSIAAQVKPPSSGDFPKTLLAASEIQKNTAVTRATNDEAQRKEYDLFTDKLGRAARDILMQPEGPERTARWNHYVDEFYQQGHLNRLDHARYYNNPDQTVLNQAIAHSMDPERYQRMTGGTAGAEAAARAPFEYREMPAETPGGYPAIRPGGPLAGTSPPQAGSIPSGLPGRGPPSPDSSGSLVSPPTPSTPAGPTPITGPTAGVAPPPAGPSSVLPGAKAVKTKKISPTATPSDAAPPPPPAASVKDTSSPEEYAGQAPATKIGPQLPAGPGVVNQGVHPMVLQAHAQGMKQINEEIQPEANKAQRSIAELGNLKNELSSGKVSTGRLTDIKMSIAGFMEAMGVNGDSITKTLGINLPWQQIADKDMTRMGLLFARQTEGAREAVMAINIALRANPQMANTTEGNLKILDILQRSGQYDIEQAKGAQGYFQKQQQENGGYGHLFGFHNWWDADHSPSRYMSRAVPYPLPSNQADLKVGNTYEWQNKEGRTVRKTWDGSGFTSP